MIAEKSKNLIKKQPVVVLVGHIDHGKSSILQKIKDFKITQKETGGITQHIGAYEVEEKGQKITFIDTPGHEAFGAMRARGAKVADIAILVVAAEEGIKPQTKEAINHIKKAQISMIVALNKIDKPEAQAERVRDELAKNDVLVEERGGKIPSIEVSAKTGKGISGLLDLILLVAEMENLQADISRRAEGVIIESYLDSKRGPTATLLVENGTLKGEEIVGTPSCIGKIKRMEDFQGIKIEQARPGQPASVLGFEKVPVMGEKFKVFSNLETAREKVEKKETEAPAVISLEPEQKILNLVLKTDVLGSIEPIEKVLAGLPQEKVFLRLLKKEAGKVNFSDVKLAEAGKAVVLGFRAKAPNEVLEAAKRKGIRILNFDLIYDLVEEIRGLMEKILAQEIVRVDLGKLETLIIFKTQKTRQIIGARVLEGEIKKGVKLEVFRSASPQGEAGEEEENKVGEGRVIELQKDKKEIDKGEKGDEVGILYQGSVKIQEGDILLAYEKKSQKVTLH
jgi:translation initiation factor IF-2